MRRLLLGALAPMIAACGSWRAHPSPFARPSTCVVHVIDEAGHPVAGAAVHVQIANVIHTEAGPGRDRDTAEVTSGRDGIALVPIPAWTAPRYAIAREAGAPPQAVDVTEGRATITLGPARAIPGHVDLGGCPGGHIDAVIEPVLEDWPRASRDLPAAKDLEPARAVVAPDGTFAVGGVGPGAYRVQVEACGTEVTGHFRGRDARIELTLPARRAERPTAIPLSIARAATAAPACRFAPPPGPILTGDVHGLFLDRSCRLFAESAHEQWTMISASGVVVPLGVSNGSALAGPGDRAPDGILTAGAAIAVIDRSSTAGTTTRVVAIAPGGTADDLGALVDRALAPHRDLLAYQVVPPAGDPTPQALVLRAVDGARHRVADAATDYAWTDDDRLAYVAPTTGRSSGVVHLVDPRDGADRALGAATVPWNARPVLWPVHGRLLVESDETLDQIDLATLERTRLVDQVDEVSAVDHLALYRAHAAMRLRDLDTGATVDVGGVIGNGTPRLIAAPGGQWLLSGADVAVAVDGELRLLCEAANLVDVNDRFALCEEAGWDRDTQRVIAVPLDGHSRGVAIGFVYERWRLAPDRAVAYGIRIDGTLVALHLDDLREETIAPSASSFLPLDGGRVLSGVRDQGVTIRSTPPRP